MNSRAGKIATLGIALVFLLFSGSQGARIVSSCSMPCCGGKSDRCHAPKERVPEADHCCEAEASFALGADCRPELNEPLDLTTVSQSSPHPAEGVEMSVLEVAPKLSQGDEAGRTSAPPPPGRAPLYLQNLNLLI